jgi:hypothetical protein
MYYVAIEPPNNMAKETAIEEWCKINAGKLSKDWGLVFNAETGKTVYMFSSSEIAMMFSLRWL